MKRFVMAIMVACAGVAWLPGISPALAQNGPDASGTVDASDLETKRRLMSLANAVLAKFAAHASKGSLEDFDPGPAIESALSSALASHDMQLAIDRLVDQVASDADNAAISPQTRDLLKAAVSAVVVLAKTELTRELSGTAASNIRSPSP